MDLFAQADKDKNWVVSRQEFRNIIRSWRIPLTDVDLEDLILALDRDNSDALDYRELAVGRQSYLEERWAYMYNILFQFANLKYFLSLISRAVTIFWVCPVWLCLSALILDILQFCTNKIKDAIANENKEQYQKGK